jgi:hypothetical protein
MLQKILNEVIRHFDCSVICGYRDEAAQNEAYYSGHSKVRYPNSRHNTVPAMAVDVVPYPIDWKDTERFCYFAGFVMGVAAKFGYPIRWGGDWDKDTEVKDNTFNDLAHFEIIII